MKSTWVEKFVGELRAHWGPLSSELVAANQTVMQELAKAAGEHELGKDLPGNESSIELYRDARHGFVLTAYAEEEGRYRAPHDHGAGWVIYAVAEGSVEMGTYAKLGEGRSVPLVRRNSTRMEAGASKVFLPGDIHDTLCASRRAVILRLTSCDLRKEDAEGRMARFSAPAPVSPKLGPGRGR